MVVSVLSIGCMMRQTSFCTLESKIWLDDAVSTGPALGKCCASDVHIEYIYFLLSQVLNIGLHLLSERKPVLVLDSFVTTAILDNLRNAEKHLQNKVCIFVDCVFNEILWLFFN